MTNTGLKMELAVIEDVSSPGVYLWNDTDSPPSKLLDRMFENQAVGSRARHVIAVLDCFDGENRAAIGIILTNYGGTNFQRLICNYLLKVDTNLVDTAQFKTLLVSPESKWPIPRGPRQLLKSEYTGWVFLHPQLLLSKFWLLQPGAARQIWEHNGSFSLKLTFDTAAILTVVLGAQEYTIYFGILSQNRHGRPWIVCCSVTASVDGRKNLDICKKHLEQHGEARNDQDGIWTDQTLRDNRMINISAFNASGSREELQDLVYICGGEKPLTSAQVVSGSRGTGESRPLTPRGHQGATIRYNGIFSSHLKGGVFDTQD
jgi:hypothetical protein